MVTKLKNPFIGLMLLSFLLTSPGCNRPKIQLNLEEEIEYFGEDFLKHFPREIYPQYSFVFSQDIFDSHPHVWLKVRLSELEKDSLLNYLKENSIATYAAEDTCVLALDSHLNSDNRYESDKQNFRTRRLENKSEACGVELLPIPKFYGIDLKEDPNSPSGLWGYNFYVLSAEKGEFYDRSILTNSAFAPDGWDHGISKGVALNESTNIAIYWSDVW